MTPAVQRLLDPFDTLADVEKHQAAVEILRRVSSLVEGDLPESTLMEAADELFRRLDDEEAVHAQR